MCKKTQRLIGLSLGIIVLLTVCVAFAQEDANKPKACSLKKASACSASDKTAACSSQKKAPTCKDSTGCGSCAVMSKMPVYLDGPGALLAQAKKLGLTDEQKASLNKILANARKEAIAVLTDEQRTKLGDIADEPIIACKGGANKTCGAGCTRPCCADKTKAKACAPDCNKPCCADKTAAVEQKVCPIMGTPINMKLFSEYKGKKVYFCCPSCKTKFEADPQKYLDKLPQFKK